MKEFVRFFPIKNPYDGISPGRLVCAAQIEKLSNTNKKSAAKASTQKKSNSLYHGPGR